MKFATRGDGLKFKLDHSPLFSSAKLKMPIVAVKVIWVSSDHKTGESEAGANSNALVTCVFVALNFVTLLEFSEQDFILETVMRSYSRLLDFLKLNPYVDLRQITKLTIHSTLFIPHNSTLLSFAE